MKKLIALTCIAISITFTANSQEKESNTLITKKGTPMLPQKGDYGIGVDATPFLTYIGNIFGKTDSNDAPEFTTNSNDMTITGKYFKNNNTAYRASVRVGVLTTKENVYVRDDIAFEDDPSTKDQVTDINKYTESNISLGFGIEKRRGYGRLQGVYGFMGNLGFGTAKYTFEHGNDITEFNKYPTRDTHMNEIKMGSTFVIGANAFVGIEYFIAPKLSFGGEFTYGFSYGHTGEGTSNYDFWNNGNGAFGEIDNEETKIGGDSEFSLDNTVTSSISLNFYF